MHSVAPSDQPSFAIVCAGNCASSWPHSSLPPGLYLLGAQPAAAQRSRVELEFDLQRLVASVAA